LPSQLSALPIMTLGLLKHPAFKETADVRSDERARQLGDLRVMGVTEMETFVRPRMLPLHNLDGNVGLLDENDGSIVLPPEVNLTAAYLTSDSAYLIDNGVTFFLRVGRALPPSFLQELFGIQSLEKVDTRQLRLLDSSTSDPKSLLARVTNILNCLRTSAISYQNLRIFKEGDSIEAIFYSYLIEDRGANLPSFPEFMHHVFQGATF